MPFSIVRRLLRLDLGLPRLNFVQARNDTGVSGKTANACLSARNDSSFFVWRCFLFFRLPEIKKHLSLCGNFGLITS
ncbi:MAG: hypothetical protein IKZ88_10365 [Neisseriaceae bacterium]|nr:hypothetical protein [Neisseriaceae bacterium]